MNPDIRQALEAQTVGRALLVVVLLALIAPFVVYAVPATVGAEASYVVLTASMTPAIAPGDVVIVDAVPARDVRVGDVIVFEQQAGDPIPITHRVIAVDRPVDAPPEFRTKGDANEDADLTPVTPDRLVGRVAFTIPLIGHVVQFVGTPTGFVALVVLPLGLLVVSEVVDLLRSGRSGESLVGDGDGGGADAVSTADPADADNPVRPTATVADDQVVITPADLTLTSVALGAFAVYAGYAALQETTTVSVTLAVAVGALFALAAGIRLFGLSDADIGADTGTLSADTPAVRVHDARPSGPTVDVASPADLRAIAGTLGCPVLRDDRNRYVVLDGTVTYAYDVPTEAGNESDAEVGTVDGAERDDAGAPSTTPPTAPAPADSGGVGR